MKRINAIDALSILLLLLIVNQDQAFGFQMARSVSATTAYSSISANALDRISSTTRSSSTTTDESSFELSKLSNNAVCSNRRNFAIHMASRDHRYEYQYIGRDADYGEILAGGQRYEMVELPDSMVDTTIFVGNLCEFVTDDMLSTLFQQVSHLKFVPACVARKPNMSSLKYGFVTFPTVSEKEAAIIKFTGYELNNKKIRVEEIQDHKFRVRVPEKLVVYAVGEVKRTREGKKNTMRKVTNSRTPELYDYDFGSSSSSSTGSSTSSTSSSTSMLNLPPSSSSKNEGRKNFKNSNQRRRRRKAKLSGSSMLGSGVVRQGGYKDMKRKEKRKQRRSSTYSLDDYGLR